MLLENHSLRTAVGGIVVVLNLDLCVARSGSKVRTHAILPSRVVHRTRVLEQVRAGGVKDAVHLCARHSVVDLRVLSPGHAARRVCTGALDGTGPWPCQGRHSHCNRDHESWGAHGFGRYADARPRVAGSANFRGPADDRGNAGWRKSRRPPLTRWIAMNNGTTRTSGFHLAAFVRTNSASLDTVDRRAPGAQSRLTQRRQCGRRKYACLRSARARSEPRTGSQRGSDPATISSPAASICNRRRHAPGEFRTRFVHSARSWSTIFARSTSRTAMAPRAAARRSSYAARRQATEHHFLGRPPGSPIQAFPQRRHVPLK